MIFGTAVCAAPYCYSCAPCAWCLDWILAYGAIQAYVGNVSDLVEIKNVDGQSTEESRRRLLLYPLRCILLASCTRPVLRVEAESGRMHMPFVAVTSCTT